MPEPGTDAPQGDYNAPPRVLEESATDDQRVQIKFDIAARVLISMQEGINKELAENLQRWAAALANAADTNTVRLAGRDQTRALCEIIKRRFEWSKLAMETLEVLRQDIGENAAAGLAEATQLRAFLP